MESSTPARVLVVAHKTAATPPLMDAVRERAARGPSKFTLLVPKAAHGLHRVVDLIELALRHARCAPARRNTGWSCWPGG